MTTKLALTDLANGQSNYLNANETFAKLNQLVMAGAVDKDLFTPPGSPENEALYIVSTSSTPTGAWAGKGKNLAFWLSSPGSWYFMPPLAGWSVRVLDELDGFGVPKVYVYTGSDWTIPDSGTATAAPAAVVTDTTTARTLGLTDAGKYLRFTNTSAKAVTVPPQSSVTWLADTEVHIRNAAASNLTLTAGSGVTLSPAYLGTLIVPPGGAVTLKRVASDVWDVIGQTV